MRVVLQEYGIELPLDIAFLERRLERNVDVSTSNSTDKPEVITEDGYDK